MPQHKHKGKMPPKGKHMMPGGKEMMGEHHPAPKPKPKPRRK